MTDLICDDCADEFDDQGGCLCDGHQFCASCLTNCRACAAGIRDDHAAELAMERGR